MRKYPIDRFYVGKLNIGFKMGNLLQEAVDPKLSKRDKEQFDLISDTKFIGAIDLYDRSCADLTDWNLRYRYDSLFTLFYRNNDDSYTCVHNGDTFTCEKGENYVSDLVPLSSCLPTIAVKQINGLTSVGAVMLFNRLFKTEKKPIFTGEKFPVDKFHFGYLDLYTGDSKNDANLPQRILLSRYGANAYGGCSSENEETGEEKNYMFYQVIVLMPDDGKIYNIDDHRTYVPGKSLIDGTEFKLGDPIRTEEEFREGLKRQTSIGDVLKLQRTMKGN